MTWHQDRLWRSQMARAFDDLVNLAPNEWLTPFDQGRYRDRGFRYP
ncbi:hypothetical protein ACWD3J_47755 [Streptomyces sp. NPDC002755]